MHTIIIEPTANPNVMKFVADYTLIPGSLELDRTSDISEIPLAQELFNYPFVSKVFISANFVAIYTIIIPYRNIIHNYYRIFFSHKMQHHIILHIYFVS